MDFWTFSLLHAYFLVVYGYCMSSTPYGILSPLGQPNNLILLNHISEHVRLACGFIGALDYAIWVCVQS
jgi:hypothetical protein